MDGFHDLGGRQGFGQITVEGKKSDAKIIAMLTKLSGNKWRLYHMMNEFE